MKYITNLVGGGIIIEVLIFSNFFRYPNIYFQIVWSYHYLEYFSQKCERNRNLRISITIQNSIIIISKADEPFYFCCHEVLWPCGSVALQLGGLAARWPFNLAALGPFPGFGLCDLAARWPCNLAALRLSGFRLCDLAAL